MKKTQIKPALAVLMALGVSAGSLMAYALDPITDTAMKRLFISRMNARCHYFSAETDMALKAGFLQARNEALRSGHPMSELGTHLEFARNAAQNAACDTAAIVSEAQGVSDSYRKFIMQTHLELQGERSVWQATRANESVTQWRLVQYQRNDDQNFAIGLYGTMTAPRFMVMSQFADQKRPISARLLVRNADIASIGVINRSPFALSPTRPQGSSELSDQSFVAQGMEVIDVYLRPHQKTNDLGYSLTGEYVGDQSPTPAIAYSFPTKAFVAIARLDPREDVVVEYMFDDGPRYVRFEIGDMMTGLVYATLPSAYGG